MGSRDWALYRKKMENTTENDPQRCYKFMWRTTVCLAVYGDVFVCVCLCQTTIKLYNLNLCLGPPASLNFKLKKMLPWRFYLHWMSNHGGCLIHNIHVERNIGVLRAMVYTRICKSPSSLRNSSTQSFDSWFTFSFGDISSTFLVCSNDRSVSFSLWSHVYSLRWYEEEKENQKRAKRKWVIDIQADA